MESKYYLHKITNRLVRVIVNKGLTTKEHTVYFVNNLNPPFDGKNIDKPAFDLLVRMGRYIPVNQSTAEVLYGK